MTECTKLLQQELRAQRTWHKTPDDLMPALYIVCPWFSILVEIWFPQHHIALQLHVTSGTKVLIQMYFSAGLKYFQNAFLCSDTAFLWHSITSLISNLDFQTKCLQLNHRLCNKQGINLFLYSNISKMCRPTLRLTQPQTDSTSS